MAWRVGLWTILLTRVCRSTASEDWAGAIEAVRRSDARASVKLGLESLMLTACRFGEGLPPLRSPGAPRSGGVRRQEARRPSREAACPDG